MKFCEMEDGKEYIARPSECIYRKVEQLLQFRYQGESRWDYPKTRIDCISTMDFDEAVEYHTVEEAITHMENGGIARFNKDMIYLSQGEYRYVNSACCLVPFNTILLKPQWQLLRTEESINSTKWKKG